MEMIVRNVHEALPRSLRYLRHGGIERDSRNGKVLFGGTVSTIYQKPAERVIFWPERDANPFFHLYESLWMLQGRNDVEPLTRYAKRMATFSDDGYTLHGAYGYRWRNDFGDDQLDVIARRLRVDPDDRRCVLQMWSSISDLGVNSKDLPCNIMATFQRGITGELNLVVFCRSNDIIWGAYGANAVHFSFLLEYMAAMIDCPIGTYTQISVNYHAYLDVLAKHNFDRVQPEVPNPYETGQVHVVPMRADGVTGIHLDDEIAELVEMADTSNFNKRPSAASRPWANMVWRMLYAHHLYKEGRKVEALMLLETGTQDWVVAGREWLLRRS